MGKINFKQLETFTAIHDTRSFRAAARKLGLAQSSVSKHIQELESGFFLPLFDRSSRAAKLTIEGLDALERARDILQIRDEILQHLSGQEAVTVSRLHIGLTELTALTWLPALVERIKSSFPRVSVIISMEQGLTLLQRLNIGELDLIVLPDVFRNANVLSTPLAKIQSAWFCSASFPIPQEAIPAPRLNDYTLLMQSQQSTAGVFLGSWMRQHAVFPKDIFSCDSLVALGGIAASGLGVAALPVAVSGPLVEAGLLREVKVNPGLDAVPYSIVARAELHPPIIHEVVAIAQSVCNFETPYSHMHSLLD